MPLQGLSRMRGLAMGSTRQPIPPKMTGNGGLWLGRMRANRR